MNRMGEVLDLLGIEDYSVNGQEYDLYYNKEEKETRYFCRRSGNRIEDGEGGDFESSEYTFLITGEWKLVPRPWAPTEDDVFYIIDITSAEGFRRYNREFIGMIKTFKKRGVKFYRTLKEIKSEVKRLYESGEWER